MLSKLRVRKEICSLPNYFDTKGAAIQAADMVLANFGWETGDCNPLGDDGRELIPIVKREGRELLCEEVGTLVFSWYRMPSGRYEVIMYLS